MLVACSVLTIDRIIDAIRSAPGDVSGTAALGLLRTSDLVLAGLAGALLGCLV